MPRRIAVVLRGPMGVGKTTVARELCRLLAAGPTINLDEHYQILGLARDAIFTPRKEDALVFELSCGEPEDLSFKGFTRGAVAWHDALRQDGREVHLVKLWAELETIRQHMVPERPNGLLWASFWHRGYSTGLDIVSLPTCLAALETTIDVTDKSPAEIAREVLGAVARRGES